MTLIVDTDCGYDDALALFLLLGGGADGRTPIPDLVTTIAGNTDIGNATRNAHALLSLAGRGDIPVAAGAAAPLVRPLRHTAFHGLTGLDGLDTSVFPDTTVQTATHAITTLIRAYPGHATILCLGPLTNIAGAFRENPDLPGMIARLVIMGGAIARDAGPHRAGEFNMSIDPEAAATVMGAPVAKTIIPLDLCEDTRIPRKDFGCLAGTRLHQPITQSIDMFLSAYGGRADDVGVYDALAAYAVIRPDAFRLQSMSITVETRDPARAGVTVFSLADNHGDHRNIVQVATGIDKESFISDLFATLRACAAGR